MGKSKSWKKKLTNKLNYSTFSAAALIAAPRVIVEWSFSLILLLKPNYIVHTIGVSEKAGKPIFCIISLKKLSLFFSSGIQSPIMGKSKTWRRKNQLKIKFYICPHFVWDSLTCQHENVNQIKWVDIKYKNVQTRNIHTFSTNHPKVSGQSNSDL